MAVRAKQIKLGVLADPVLKEQILDTMYIVLNKRHTEFMPVQCTVLFRLLSIYSFD